MCVLKIDRVAAKIQDPGGGLMSGLDSALSAAPLPDLESVLIIKQLLLALEADLDAIPITR